MNAAIPTTRRRLAAVLLFGLFAAIAAWGARAAYPVQDDHYLVLLERDHGFGRASQPRDHRVR